MSAKKAPSKIDCKLLGQKSIKNILLVFLTITCIYAIGKAYQFYISRPKATAINYDQRHSVSMYYMKHKKYSTKWIFNFLQIVAPSITVCMTEMNPHDMIPDTKSKENLTLEVLADSARKKFRYLIREVGFSNSIIQNYEDYQQ